MHDAALRAFASPAEHAAISEIIHRRSSNPADIRELALAGLDLSRATDALDLGCGFGYLTATLLPRLPAQARVVGVDACEANRGSFLELVSQAGRRGEFQAFKIDRSLP